MDKELQKRVDRANEQMVVEGSESPQEGSNPQNPIDYYQEQQDLAYTVSARPKAYGSPAQLSRVVDKMAEDFKQVYYNIAKNLYSHLKEYGLDDNANVQKQKYMVEKFLPFVESLVETYGVGALVNNKQALAKLDELVITDNGDGSGYTEAYLGQMHKGQPSAPSESDAEVSYQLGKARTLASNGDVRAGVQLAKQIRERVDQGELSANEADYDLLMQAEAQKPSMG